MRLYIRVSIFTSILGLAIGLTYHTLRFGLDDNSWLEVVKVVGVLFFLIFAPIRFSRLLNERYKIFSFYSDPSFLLASCIFFMALLGVALSYLPTSVPCWIISAAGIILFVYYFVDFLKQCTWKDYLVGGALTMIFAELISSLFYAGVAKPIFFEGLAAGYVPYNWKLDTLFQTSLSQMIYTYGKISVGLDGLAIMNYHFFSNYVFARFADLFQMDIFKVYILVNPIVFGALFFQLFLQFVLRICQFLSDNSSKKVHLGYLFWILFFTIFIGAVNRSFVYEVGLEDMVPGFVGNMGFGSESFLFSVILIFMLWNVLLSDANSGASESKFLYLVFLPTLIFVIGLTKISSGFLILCLSLYIFVRLGLYKKTLYNLSFLLSATAGIASIVLTWERGSSESAVNFEFFRKNSTWFIVGFFTLFYFWTYVLIIIFAINEKIKDWRGLLQAARNKKTIFLEGCIILALSGLVPVIIFNLGDTRGNFLAIHFFVATGLLLSYFCSMDMAWLYEKYSLKTRRVVFWISFLILGNHYLDNAYHHARQALDLNFLVRKNIVGDVSESSPRLMITEFIRQGNITGIASTLNAYGRSVQKTLNQNREYKFLQKLRQINRLPIQEKRKSMIYADYHHLSVRLGVFCVDLPFLLPSLTGVVQLNGMMVKGECEWKGYGFDNYPYRTPEDASKIYTDEEICKMAKSHGFYRVIICRDSGNFDTISCSP